MGTNETNSVHFVNILGVDYNINLIQWIQPVLPNKQIVLGLLGSPTKYTIQFPDHMSNDEVVIAYKKLIKAGRYDHDEKNKQFDVMFNGLSGHISKITDTLTHNQGVIDEVKTIIDDK